MYPVLLLFEIAKNIFIKNVKHLYIEEDQDNLSQRSNDLHVFFFTTNVDNVLQQFIYYLHYINHMILYQNRSHDIVPIYQYSITYLFIY